MANVVLNSQFDIFAPFLLKANIAPTLTRQLPSVVRTLLNLQKWTLSKVKDDQKIKEFSYQIRFIDVKYQVILGGLSKTRLN